MQPEKPRRIIKECGYQILKKNKKKIVVLLCLILVGVIISGVLPYLYGKLIDAVTRELKRDFKLGIYTYFSLLFAALLLGRIEDCYGEWVSFQASKRMKEHLFQKMLFLKCKLLDQLECGKLLSRMNGDAESVTGYYINLFTSAMTIGINAAMALWFTFHISIKLAIVAILFIPISVIFNYMFRMKYRRLQKEQREFTDKYFAFQVSILSNITTMKSYVREDHCSKIFKTLLDGQWELIKKNKLLMSCSVIIANCITNASSFLLLYYSATLIWNEEFTIGSMISFMTYIALLSREVNHILDLSMESQKVYVSLARIKEFEEVDDERNKETSLEGKSYRASGGLNVENIFFSYKRGQRYLLKNMSLKISGNGLYSLVGKNGSGKSSFLKLLVRYYDYEEGAIIIGGQEIRGLTFGELRKKIKYISKETCVLDATFLENIYFFYDGVSESRVKEAYHKAGLAEFIEGLPQKYKTKVGENGSMLSSGQRQKLNIARALLSEADVFLFDEITSDLDGRAEQEILKVLKALSKDKLIIHATHRKASAKEGDIIFLLEDGRIQMSGSHEILWRDSRSYRELFCGNETKNFT